MRILQTVKGRIYAAFSIVSAIIVALGGTAILMSYSAEQLFAEYRYAARQSLEINDYVRDVETLRENLSRYLRQPSADVETAVRDMILDVGTTDVDGKAFFVRDSAALDVIDTVTALSAEYTTAFDAVVAEAAGGVVNETSPQLTRLFDIGAEMSELYNGMSDRAKDVQNALGPRIADQQQQQLLMIVAVAAVGAVAGIGLAILTARWLGGAIGGLAGTMRRLAEGHYDDAISGTDARNELGDMARAMETFRINGQQVIAAQADKQAQADGAQARADRMARYQRTFDAIMVRATNGDFSGRIDERFGEPELDRLSDNVNAMLGSIEAALGEADTVLGALARADLQQRMLGTYSGAFDRLKTSTNNVAGQLTKMVVELRETSRSLKLATGEILAGANDLSERTTRQASTIEETSATMEQMASAVTLNAQRARDASASARDVTKVVEASSQVMTEATEAMVRISTSSGKISNIIGLIDDIAFQTNLLALNASVEAARAGEAGKGFAVVAVEVRRLAQSAAQASSEVKTLIEQSAQEVAGGTRLVGQVAARLAEIIEGVKQTAQVMESIASDSNQQASGISEVNVAVRQMDEMTQHNAALVEEMNASIEQTEGQAGKLDGIVETFVLDAQPAPVRALAAAPKPVEPETGVRSLLGKVRHAARPYFGGAAAEDWNEF